MDAEYTGQNRRAWNEIALLRARRWAAKHPDEQILRGEMLAADVRAAVGDVTGRSLLHLQCASGEESLSWAALGAEVTAVDIADGFLEPARARASRLGLDVRFVAADVLDLPEDLLRGSFHVVYTSGGVLVWLPALEPWAMGIERALSRGGRLVLEEEHPLAQTLRVRDGAIEMEDDYFQRGRAEEDPPGWSHFDDQGTATETKYGFVWPLGDVVTALASAGLRIERVEESATTDDQLWRYRDAMDAARPLPGSFLLVATKV